SVVVTAALAQLLLAPGDLAIPRGLLPGGECEPRRDRIHSLAGRRPGPARANGAGPVRLAAVEGNRCRVLLDGHSRRLGLSDAGVHRLPGVRRDHGLLANAEEPGPCAGAVRGHPDQHPVLVRRSWRGLCPVVSAAGAAAGLSAEPLRPAAAA